VQLSRIRIEEQRHCAGESVTLIKGKGTREKGKGKVKGSKAGKANR
jgi:hypothetical protein